MRKKHKFFICHIIKEYNRVENMLINKTGTTAYCFSLWIFLKTQYFLLIWKNIQKCKCVLLWRFRSVKFWVVCLKGSFKAIEVVNFIKNELPACSEDKKNYLICDKLTIHRIMKFPENIFRKITNKISARA